MFLFIIISTIKLKDIHSWTSQIPKLHRQNIILDFPNTRFRL